jgi:zinc/manganese transport system substrate-binding protein
LKGDIIMNRTILLICLLLIAICAVEPGECIAKDKLNIVTTTTNLASIAKTIGGEHVNVSSISTGKEDPHFIEAKPSYMLKAKDADLWIRNGLELEIGYEELIIEGSRNQRIRIGSPGHLDASEGITPLEVPILKIDRSMGDVHPLGNPHYWLDPENGKIIAQNICRRLKQLDPEHADDYDRNLASFERKIDNAMAGWSAKLKPFEHTKIITYHRSWSYFARRFDLEVAAELEPKPGIPPSPGHLKDVIETVKENNIKVCLIEPFYNEKPANFISQNTGVKVVVVPASVNGTKEAQDYIGLIDTIVEKLSEALKNE